MTTIPRRPRSARKLLTSAARIATLVYVGAAETACNLQVSPCTKNGNCSPAVPPAVSCISPGTVTAQPLSANQLPTGLKLLLRADDLTVLADGDAVGNWPDASGNGFDLQGYNGTPQGKLGTGVKGRCPVKRSSGIKGKPTVSFDGVGSFLQRPFAGSLTDKTMCVVAKLASLTPSALSQGGSALSIMWANGSNFEAIVYNELTPKRWMNGSENHVRSPLTVSPTDETSSDGVLICIRSTANNYEIYRNGTLLVSTKEYSPPTIVQGAFLVGTQPNGAATYFGGEIAEILVFDSAISEAGRKQIEQYLNAKYNLY